MNVINLEGAKWFIENYVRHKILDCYRNPANCGELRNVLNDLKELRNTIIKLISEINDMLKVRKGVEALTSSEYLTIAVSLRPNAPESIKRKAQEIIYRYGLTEEQVKAIYKSVFGGGV